jgi:hypothetical protein
MKKFRGEVWITDEDYDIIEGIPADREMTKQEIEALHRAINKYYFSYYDDYIGLKFGIGFLIYTFLCMLTGLFVGRWLG